LNWERITQVLGTISGYKIEFNQTHSESPSCSSEAITEANTINDYRGSELGTENGCNK